MNEWIKLSFSEKMLSLETVNADVFKYVLVVSLLFMCKLKVYTITIEFGFMIQD